VVILREGELDTDLATAIQRIREQPDTRRARILVVGAEGLDDGEALPVPALAATAARLGHLRAREALAREAARLTAQLECLDLFVDEADRVARRLAEDVGDEPRARLQREARELGDILDWARAVRLELGREVSALGRGAVPTAVGEPLAEAVAQIRSAFPGLAVRVPDLASSPTVRGSAVDLNEVFFLALLLVAHRVGGRGVLAVGVERQAERVAVVCTGYGEPREVCLPESVARLRALVDTLDGTLAPGLLGPAGAGIAVGLPRVD
jgi:hypothetical protein